MKRTFLLLVLLFSFLLGAKANYVDNGRARQMAANFLNVIGDRSPELMDVSSEAGFSNVYVFTTENSFVLLAADDRVQPVLGYSLNGRFDFDNMPDNKRAWIQGYSDNIQYAIDHQLSASSEVTQQWRELAEGNINRDRSVIIGPLLQTQWNQSSPYNLLCPSGSVTGCVATAMAQVMKYWNYPEHGIGQHSYTHNTYGELSANFQSTIYDWTNMTNIYNSYNTDIQKMAVATLMYHCGVSVDMNYSPNASGATTAHVANALKAYFNYSSDVQYHSRSEYDDDTWIAMLKADLNLNRPIQYSGHGSGGGHSFVCDGYNSDNYFHFNWGWGGYCDEYYVVNNLNPGPGGIGSGSNGIYNDNQGAIFGIHPSDCAAGIPLNLDFVQNGRNVTLSWSSASGAVNYNVYCNNSYIGNTNSISYTHMVSYGNSTFYVRSVDSNGELSLSSNEVTVIVDYPIPLVDDLAATASDNNVNLTWSSPDWCYPAMPTATMTYGEGSYNGYFGSSGNSLYWGHRYPVSSLNTYDNMYVYKVSFYAKETGIYKVYLYKGTSTGHPQTEILQQTVMVGAVGWFDIDLSNTIQIDASKDLWVFINDPECKNSPATFCSYSGNEGNYYSTAPTSRVNTMDNLAFLIRTFVSNGTYTYNLYRNGTSIANNLSSTFYSDNNLASGYYSYYVKTNYYAGESNASNQVSVSIGNSNYTISASAYPSEGGTVSGGGAFNNGATCTLTATPTEGYSFVNWTENGNVVSTNSTFSFNVSGDRNLVAHFSLSENHWIPEGTNYSGVMSVYGVIQIDGVEQYSNQLEVGAFCGDECRGSAIASEFYLTHRYLAIMTVYGEIGHQLTFKLYDHSTGQEYEPATQETIAFTEDGYGNPIEPYILNFTGAATSFHFITAGYWSQASNWSGGVLPGANNEVFIDAPCQLDMNATVNALTVSNGQLLTVQSGKTLNVSGILTNTITTGLVIEDGAQLVHASENVSAMVKKNITGYGSDNGNFFLISNPLASSVNPELASVYHLTIGNYDLYDWLSSSPDNLNWRNFKEDAFMMLPEGYGYLYSNQNGMELNFPGTLKSSLYRFSKTVSYDSNDYEHPGWNLIGNPFMCDAYLVNNNNELLPYYRINSTGDGLVADTSGVIVPMEGVFYHASGNETVYFIRTDFTSQIPNYTISVSVNSTGGGSVAGGGTYQQGQSCTVTATPATGYTFLRWTENGNQVSTSANYIFTVTDNRTLVAQFQAQTPNTYTINVSPNPSSGGTVTGGGTYAQGASCTVTAAANTGYTFLRWTENGTQVSTNASYTFNVNGNRTLVAQFQAQGYSINVSTNPSNSGTVSGGGSYNYGQSCTVTATAATGYTFLRWTENGTQVSTNANYTFTVTGNRTLVAQFQVQSYTINVSANPNNGGTMSGGGSYNYGQNCTVTATAATGYTFLRWSENGTQVSTDDSYTFTVTCNRTLVAQFQAPIYTINVSANPNNGGTVSGGGSYNYGQSCTVSAAAAMGYTFLRWTENGTQVSTNANYTFSVTGSRNLVAQFQVQSYNISVTANLSGGGTVSGGGSYNYGQSCTVMATPADGYIFANWTENGNVVQGAGASHTFTVTDNRALVANFSYNTGYVDLGLPSGTLWANLNVGAGSWSNVGTRFAWGETDPKTTYSWDAYQYCSNGDYHQLTKYCTNSNYGLTDNLTTLLPEDDAATANWGTGWRIPTKEEWQELYNNTTHRYTKINNITYCIVFTAANGNNLILPVTGYMDENGYNGAVTCNYWSSSLYTNQPYEAWYFGASSNSCSVYRRSRNCGLSVRAVRSGQ